MRSQSGLLRFLWTQNPFYLIGTALLLYGLQVATQTDTLFVSHPLTLALVLSVVMLVMALVAIAIIKLGGVWDDARTIMLSIFTLMVAVVTGCDSMVHSHPKIVVWVLSGLLFYCMAICELLFRSLKIWFPADVRIPFYGFLSLIIFYSLVFGPVEEWVPWISSVSAAWKVYAFGWLIGCMMLLCLPAVWQSSHLFRDTGTPWKWPWFPWSIFVVLVGAACLRLFLLSLAFVPGHGWTNPIGLHFFLPVLFAATILLIESMIVESKVSDKADINDDAPNNFEFGLISAILLFCSIRWSGSELYLSFHHEITYTLGSPMWISLIFLLLYGTTLWWRFPKGFEASVSTLIILSGWVQYQSASLEFSWQAIWPIVLFVGFHGYLAMRDKSMARWIFLTVMVSLATGALFSQFGVLLATFASLQTFWLGTLLIGVNFHSRAAILVRLLAIGLMIGSALFATASIFLLSFSGWVIGLYIFTMQFIAVLAWAQSTWPLLRRVPIALVPFLVVSVAGDYLHYLSSLFGVRAGVFLLVAMSCFGLGFLISCWKAGWLNSVADDWRRLTASIRSELRNSNSVRLRESNFIET